MMSRYGWVCGKLCQLYAYYVLQMIINSDASKYISKYIEKYTKITEFNTSQGKRHETACR